MERIYISGPITGHEDYLAEFALMEDKVKARFDGKVEIINPGGVYEYMSRLGGNGNGNLYDAGMEGERRGLRRIRLCESSR